MTSHNCFFGNMKTSAMRESCNYSLYQRNLDYVRKLKLNLLGSKDGSQPNGRGFDFRLFSVLNEHRIQAVLNVHACLNLVHVEPNSESSEAKKYSILGRSFFCIKTGPFIYNFLMKHARFFCVY